MNSTVSTATTLLHCTELLWEPAEVSGESWGSLGRGNQAGWFQIEVFFSMKIICFDVIAPTFSSTLEREVHLFGHLLGKAVPNLNLLAALQYFNEI